MEEEGRERGGMEDWREPTRRETTRSDGSDRDGSGSEGRKEEEWVRDWRRNTTIRQNGDGYLRMVKMGVQGGQEGSARRA
jgi:hypothetical protein